MSTCLRFILCWPPFPLLDPEHLTARYWLPVLVTWSGDAQSLPNLYPTHHPQIKQSNGPEVCSYALYTICLLLNSVLLSDTSPLSLLLDIELYDDDDVCCTAVMYRICHKPSADQRNEPVVRFDKRYLHVSLRVKWFKRGWYHFLMLTSCNHVTRTCAYWFTWYTFVLSCVKAYCILCPRRLPATKHKSALVGASPTRLPATNDPLKCEYPVIDHHKATELAPPPDCTAS